MKSKFLYLRTWLIIKRKQLLNFFPAKEKSFTKFVIVCAPRSGSTWLHTLLNSHTNIISYGEILREKFEVKPNQQLPPLEELLFHPHHASIRAVGLKLFYEYETRAPFKKTFHEIVNDPSIFIIHLIRDDKPAQFKSLKRAEASQQWSSGRSTNHSIPIPINPVEMEGYQKKLLAEEKHIHALLQNHPILIVKYEDLLSHQEKTLDDVQKFLKVKPKRLFSLLKKQT